ncbi:HigA family addiction module antidote protein [Avibacterium avium]|uniref:HigA family addiction module antidote protein n=2 Tax=Avibacterium TaxID=292486 RepID=A0A379AS53_AVIAV|nr:HigA family addiction module antidote protein [Avibacterium avium]
MRMHNPAHPGEVLKEYIEGFSITEVAQKLNVTRVALSRIINGKAAVSPEMALKLGKLLKTTPEFWLTMQANYDLWQAEQRTEFNIEPLFN